LGRLGTTVSPCSRTPAILSRASAAWCCRSGASDMACCSIRETEEADGRMGVSPGRTRVARGGGRSRAGRGLGRMAEAARTEALSLGQASNPEPAQNTTHRWHPQTKSGPVPLEVHVVRATSLRGRVSRIRSRSQYFGKQARATRLDQIDLEAEYL
jgi:hypothetical protein